MVFCYFVVNEILQNLITLAGLRLWIRTNPSKYGISYERDCPKVPYSSLIAHPAGTMKKATLGDAGIAASLRAALSHRRILSRLRRLTLPPPNAVDFSSNDFLSLSGSSILRSTFLNELGEHPDHPLGSGGSRLLDGNSSYAEALESTIASFHNAAAGLLFNSGFDANSGVFACMPQKGDAVVFDEFIHASVHEGMRLSRANAKIPFEHNSLSSFREVLQSLLEGDQAVREGKRSVFIAIESLYSMDGDLAPLSQMVDIAEDLFPFRNAHFIVDEAHATGVIGPRGRGLVCSLGLEKKIFARLHTFGKALACNGGLLFDSLGNI